MTESRVASSAIEILSATPDTLATFTFFVMHLT